MRASVLEEKTVQVLVCVFLTLIVIIFFPEAVAVGKYHIISNFIEADVLRMERSFLVRRLRKYSFVTSYRQLM